MIKVNVHEAKTNLSKLLLLIEKKGEGVRICRNSKPIADLLPILTRKKKNPLKINPALKVKFNENPMLPLDSEDWPETH